MKKAKERGVDHAGGAYEHKTRVVEEDPGRRKDRGDPKDCPKGRSGRAETVAAAGPGLCERNGRCAGAVLLPRVGSDFWPMSYMASRSCVPVEDLERYADGKPLYGWIVGEAEAYDTPSPLAEFGMTRPPMSWQYIEIPETEG